MDLVLDCNHYENEGFLSPTEFVAFEMKRKVGLDEV